MKKIKVSEATERQIDWLTAWCTGVSWDVAFKGHYTYKPSTDWSQGGPIIEREKMGVFPTHDGWAAGMQSGPTPLIAAMRCYVANKLGDEVEIPKELE